MSEIFMKFYSDCMKLRQRDPYLSPKTTCVEAGYISMLENTRSIYVDGKYYVYNDGWQEVIRKYR